MQLDIRTIIILNVAVSLLVAAGLLLARRDYAQPIRAALVRWALGMLCQPLGWLMFGFRGDREASLAIVIGNVAMALSNAEFVQALQILMNRRRLRALPYVVVGAVALWATYFSAFDQSLQARVVGVSAWVALICVQGALLSFSGAHAERGMAHWLTGGLFAAGAVILAARSVHQAVLGPPLQSIFDASPMQTLTVATATFLPVLATFGFVLMCNDSLNRELFVLAQIDPLTQVANRRTLQERAEQAMARARVEFRPLSAVMIDADHFKHINDRHGHAGGDAALKALVGALRTGLRGDDLLGRLGGEEFLVVMPGLDLDGALIAAERLRNAVAELRFAIGDQAVPLRVTAGVAALSARDDFDSLLKRADTALYEGKRAGRNCSRAAPAPA
jgi:diguanylate cyclase (GGDEF)-like protein